MAKPSALFLLAIVLGLAVIFFIVSSNPEPSYAGHPLSYWLESPETDETQQAIKAIGTNAIPFLLDWLRYEPPVWTTKLASLPIPHLSTWFWEHVGQPKTLKVMVGFGIFGTNAAPAIPELIRTMKDSSHPGPAKRAIYVLCKFGDEALPYLDEGLSDPAQLHKRAIILAISTMPQITLTNAGLAVLLKATTNSDSLVRRYAIDAVRRIAPEAAPNTSAQ
jgi:hypothetical protein